jgi:hypothetical protein
MANCVNVGYSLAYELTPADSGHLAGIKLQLYLLQNCGSMNYDLELIQGS